MRPKRSTRITLSATFAAVVAMAAAGCSPDPELEPDYVAVCVDKQTLERVTDDRCDDDNGGSSAISSWLWFYIGYRLGAPAIGSRVDASHGSYVRPTSGRISTVVPAGLGGSKYSGSGSGS